MSDDDLALTLGQKQFVDSTKDEMEKGYKSLHELNFLSDVIKHSLEENTVVIFRVPEKDIQKVAASMSQFDRLFRHHNIGAIICPLDIEIVVIPSDAKFKLNKRSDA